MKKYNYNYIIIISIFVLIIFIFFIINKNIKLEGLNYSQYIGATDEAMMKYDNLYGASCIIECAQQTIPNKCNYVLSGELMNSGQCTLYNTINNATYSPNNKLYYMKDLTIPPSLNYDIKIDKGYYPDVNLIKTINNVHKLTCDYECKYNPECTSYTTPLMNDSNNAGTCKLYKGSNTITNDSGTNIYTKLYNGVI